MSVPPALAPSLYVPNVTRCPSTICSSNNSVGIAATSAGNRLRQLANFRESRRRRVLQLRCDTPLGSCTVLLQFETPSFPDGDATQNYGLARLLTRHPEIASRLIHPPGLTSTILLVGVLRRDIVAVLVKGDLAIVFAHVNFELSRCSAALPPVVGVAKSEIAL